MLYPLSYERSAWVCRRVDGEDQRPGASSEFSVRRLPEEIDGVALPTRREVPCASRRLDPDTTTRPTLVRCFTKVRMADTKALGVPCLKPPLGNETWGAHIHIIPPITGGRWPSPRCARGKTESAISEADD